MIRARFRTLLCSLVLLVAGCGGGGSDSPEVTVQAPQTPPASRTETLAEVATMQFPAGTIGNEEVMIEKTTDDRFQTIFADTANTLFDAPIPNTYQVLVRVMGRQPAGDVRATLVVPRMLRDRAVANARLRVFYLLYQIGGDEGLLTVEPTEDMFPIDAQSVTVSIPPEAFSNEDSGGNTMQAVLFLAVVAPSSLEKSLPMNPSAAIEGKAAAAVCRGLALVRPIAGDMPINSRFGKRVHPITGVLTGHRGIDLPVSSSTPVLAMADGIMGKEMWQKDEKSGAGWGAYVVVKHANGNQTLYAHLTKGSVAPRGSVKAGQKIALSDTTGGATNAHLHVELATQGEANTKGATKIDPTLCFDPPQAPDSATVFAGIYSGTFSGDDAGSFRVMISREGVISGSGISMSEGSFLVNGSVGTGGNVTFRVGGGASTGAGFSGAIDPLTGMLSGAWINGPDTGTFFGTREAGG